MEHSTLSARTLWLGVIMIVAISAFSTSRFGSPGFAPVAQAPASACSFPACNLDGERWNPTSGECESESGPPTFARSHHPPACPEGESFDSSTGNCILNACAGDGCEARVLCRKGSRYTRHERYHGVDYGVCESRSGLGYISHEVVYCPKGFTLNTTRGVCVGNCAPKKDLLPDLIIRRVFLREFPGGRLVTQIHVGQSYYACFEVANVGAADSGPFEVGGGGLGVPTSPFQRHANLTPGASRVGCLVYRTTPSIGNYLLGIDADSRGTVHESREDNNGATLPVSVVR